MTQVIAERPATLKPVAAFGLPGAEPMDVLSFDAPRWNDWLTWVRGDRITGLAVAAWEAGSLQLSDEQSVQLLDAQRAAMFAPLTAERGLLEVGPALDAAGVDFVVLKGPALARTVYPDPSWRYFGDLDLLVRTQDWRRTCAVLEALGLERDLPEPRPGFDERFGKGCVYRAPSKAELDLHRTLVMGPFGLWLESDRLFDRTEEFPLGGRTFRRLDDASLLLHACMHAALGSWPPMAVPVRDVAQIAHFAPIDWDAVRDRAARWRLTSVVQQAFQCATDTLGVAFPPATASLLSARTSRTERRALLTYEGDRRKQGGRIISTLRAIPGMGGKVAYVRALLVPDRRFLAARMPGQRASYIARWRVILGWTRERRKARQRMRGRRA